jgi:kumamolisin
MKDNHVSLPGSFREPLAQAQAQVLGPVDANTTIEVTIVLRRRAELPAQAVPGGINSADLAANYGADPATSTS